MHALVGVRTGHILKEYGGLQAVYRFCFTFICSFVLLVASVPEETSSYFIKSMSAYIIKKAG